MSELLERVKVSVCEAMDELQVLIIEEISMVENQFLERLNLLLMHVLKSPLPFGGKQVIFLGDFHQLPPVKPFEFCLSCGERMQRERLELLCNAKKCPSLRKAFKPGDKWAFKAPVWKQLNLRHVKLEQIHRQKDARFQDVLNKIRNGILLSEEEWQALRSKKTLPPKAFAVRLMSRLDRVRLFNEAQLSAINSKPHSWNALDSVRKLYHRPEDRILPRSAQISMELEEHKQSLKNHRLPTALTLKVGAKVVLLSNLNPKRGLVNGSQGEVIGFTDTEGWVDTELQGKKSAWLEALMDEFQHVNGHLCPVVRFANGGSAAIRPIAQESLKGTSENRYMVCRTQIPLALAWALSIHKSQGMTLEHVEVSSQDIFESGQLYVGFSRATKLEGLTVTGYSREQMAMDKDVLEFYETTKWEDLGSSNVLRPGVPVEEVLAVREERIPADQTVKTETAMKGEPDLKRESDVEMESAVKIEVVGGTGISHRPSRRRESPAIIEILSSDKEDE